MTQLSSGLAAEHETETGLGTHVDMRALVKTYNNQSQFPLDMEILHHFRERHAFPGVSHYHNIYFTYSPFLSPRGGEKAHNYRNARRGFASCTSTVFFYHHSSFFSDWSLRQLTPRPSGIDCDWAKFGLCPGLWKALGTQFGQDSVKDGVIAFVERSWLSRPVGTEHLVRRNRRRIFFIEQDWYQHRYISQIYNRPLRWRDT
jgi:hypothetical protein